MNSKRYFEKHYPKFRREALLKSLLLALNIGFAAAFAVAFVMWFTPINGLWIALATLIAVTAAATPICYSKKFRPTVVSNARHLDRIGLEERMITMVQYSADESYIAQRQRMDAEQVLAQVETSQVKIKIPRKLVTATIICGVLCGAMTTVTALSAAGLLLRGDELVDAILPDPPEVFIAVTYIVEEGGYIEGEMDQLVLEGQNAEPVLAVAEEGYAFVGWDDGSTDPARSDRQITQELTFTAIFAPIDEEGNIGDDGDSGEEDGDEPGEGDGDEEGDSPSNNDSEADSDQVGEGSGKYDEWNQIIDGEKYYREFLEEYKERLIEQLEKYGDQLTDEERAIIEAYINLV